MALRTVVVIDYQNVHLTARDIFMPGQDAHQALIHPMLFARQAVATRNLLQREGYQLAELTKVLVFRGLPHVDYAAQQNRRCLDQAARWREDGVEVELRDLKYRHQLGAGGRPVLDIHGRKIPEGRGKEKGIDVLVALACVREARAADIDLVILASRDTDLVPVLDEVSDLRATGGAGIETLAWFDPNSRSFGNLRPTAPRRIWNTNLNRACFEASLDRNDYS